MRLSATSTMMKSALGKGSKMATYKYTGSDYENGEEVFSTDDMIKLIRNPELYKSVQQAEALKRKNQNDKFEARRKKIWSKGYKN